MQLLKLMLLVTKGCGTVTSENNTYFVSTDFVSPCELKVVCTHFDVENTGYFELCFSRFARAAPIFASLD